MMLGVRLPTTVILGSSHLALRVEFMINILDWCVLGPGTVIQRRGDGRQKIRLDSWVAIVTYTLTSEVIQLIRLIHMD